MANRALIVVMYDGPTDAAFVEWMNGPHYDEVKATPGILAARRYEIVDGPPDRKTYMALLETDDLEATLAWRNSPQGQRSQQEANERGVHNRYSVVCRLAYSTVPGETG